MVYLSVLSFSYQSFGLGMYGCAPRTLGVFRWGHGMQLVKSWLCQVGVASPCLRNTEFYSPFGWYRGVAICQRGYDIQIVIILVLTSVCGYLAAEHGHTIRYYFGVEICYMPGDSERIVAQCSSTLSLYLQFELIACARRTRWPCECGSLLCLTTLEHARVAARSVFLGELGRHQGLGVLCLPGRCCAGRALRDGAEGA